LLDGVSIVFPVLETFAKATQKDLSELTLTKSVNKHEVLEFDTAVWLNDLDVGLVTYLKAWLLGLHSLSESSSRLCLSFCNLLNDILCYCEVSSTLDCSSKFFGRNAYGLISWSGELDGKQWPSQHFGIFCPILDAAILKIYPS
jgi:hypothetical protein